MCCEDLSPKDHGLIVQVYRYMKEKKDDPLALATCVYKMAEAGKSRLYDWLLHASDKVVAEERYRMGLGKKDPDPNFDEKKLERELRESIKSGDLDRMVQSCFHIVRSNTDLQKPVDRSKDPCRLMWKVIMSETGRNPFIDTLYSIFKYWGRGSGRSNLLFTAACTVISEKLLKKKYSGFPIDTSLKRLVDSIKKGKGLLGVPDHAKDMHTGEGSRMGRDMIHFIEESSAVVNEDEDYIELVLHYLSLILYLGKANLRERIANAYTNILLDKSHSIGLRVKDEMFFDICNRVDVPIIVLSSNREIYKDLDATYISEINKDEARKFARLVRKNKGKCLIAYDDSIENPYFELMLSLMKKFDNKIPSIYRHNVPSSVEVTNGEFKLKMYGSESRCSVSHNKIETFRKLTDIDGYVYIGGRKRFNTPRRLKGKEIKKIEKSEWKIHSAVKRECKDDVSVVSKYVDKIFDNGMAYEVLKLRSQKLMCSCSLEVCHGHAIIALISFFHQILDVGGT